MTNENENYSTFCFDLETEELWTSGVKQMPSKYQWSQPAPGNSMNFINFPSQSDLKILPGKKSIGDSHPSLPKCRNGFLTPRCSPGKCNITLEPCTTQTPPCQIGDEKPCTVTRPDCGATCNNCTVKNPVCVGMYIYHGT